MMHQRQHDRREQRMLNDRVSICIYRNSEVCASRRNGSG